MSRYVVQGQQRSFLSMDLDTRQRPSEAIMRKKPYGKDVLFIHSYLLTRTVIGAFGHQHRVERAARSRGTRISTDHLPGCSDGEGPRRPQVRNKAAHIAVGVDLEGGRPPGE
jgi:hypothetical protein